MIDKAIARVHYQRWEQMADLFKVKFRCGITTRYNILAGMTGDFGTSRTDGLPLSTDQMNWIAAYTEGFESFENALRLAQDHMRAGKPRTKN
jgi:hypothetical protein